MKIPLAGPSFLLFENYFAKFITIPAFALNFSEEFDLAHMNYQIQCNRWIFYSVTALDSVNSEFKAFKMPI